jgi:hypothetical protein
MYRHFGFLALAFPVCAFAAWACGPLQSAEPAKPPAFAEAPIAIDGIGPIKIGMTHKQAEEASGEPIVLAGEPSSDPESCRYGMLQDGPKGLSFMMIGDRIARIDIAGNTALKTGAGAHVGSTEDAVKALYGARLSVSPHKYEPDGHTLTVEDSNAGRQYQYVFETDGKIVTSFRAGRLPEVAFVEKCG